MGDRAQSSEGRLAHLEAIIDGLGAVVWEWDDERRCYTYVSEGAQKLLGFPGDAWLQPGFWESRIHPEDAERILARARDACLAGVPDSDEYRMVRRDGQVVWVRDILSDPGEMGVRGSLRGLLVDVTESRVARERFAAKAREFDDVFRVMGDVYFRIGPDDTLLDYKAPSLDALYADPATFLNRPLADVLPEPVAGMAVDNFALARETQTVVVTEYSLPTGGVDRRWEARFLPLKGGEIAVVSRDITDRAAMQRQVAEAEERYRTLVDTSPYAIIVVGRDESIVFANAAAGALFGSSPERPLIGATVQALVADDERPGVAQEVARLRAAMRSPRGAQSHTPLPLQHTTIRSLDGSARIIERIAVGIEYRGEPAALVMARDVTSELESEKAARAAERRFAAVVDNAPFGIHLYETGDGQLLFAGANPAAERILGVSTASRIGKPVEAAFPGLEETPIPDAYRRLAKDGGTWTTEQVEYHEGGIEGAFAVTAFGIAAGRVAVMFEDVTERRRAQEAERRHAERLSVMAAQLTAAEDRERRRLAEELHDRVSQSLAVARMHLGSAESLCEGTPHEELLKASFLLEGAIAETRAITTELAPPVLYELGIGAALRWQCDDLESMIGIDAHLHGEADETGVDDEAKMVLFRAARELLTNVVKHSGTKEAWVELDSDNRWLSLTVTDRGSGFEVRPDGRSTGDSGFGLFSIRDRLPHLGGTFELQSEPGRGTCVTLRVPRRA